VPNYGQLIIYSDSTCLPRPESSSSKETWPNIIHKAIGLETPAYIRAFAGADSRELLKFCVRDLFHFGLDSNQGRIERSLVILMFGIVDSAVLPFTYKFSPMRRIPYIGSFAWKCFLNAVHPFRSRLQEFWSHNALDSDEFETNLKQILLNLNPQAVDVLLVLHPIPHVMTEKRSPNWQKSAIRYNNIKSKLSSLQSNIYLVDVTEFPAGFYISPEDGHHFSALGHEWIAREIIAAYQGVADGKSNSDNGENNEI
jgi:lysophospholipase L1-like esterase